MKVLKSNMSGKLEGLAGINTSPLVNPFCEKMAKNLDLVCSKCYSRAMLKSVRKNAAPAMARNTELLSGSILEEKDLPKYTDKWKYGRFNAHGELVNLTHAINLLNIAKKNPHMIWGFWTKRPALVQEAIAKVGKPENVMLIYSSPCLNVEAPLPSGFDRTFTVYSKEEAKTVNINCGGKKCATCLLCYTPGNGVTSIKEKVK